MNRRCEGCGSVLQSIYKENDGYISDKVKDQLLCERCFKIKHYGECSVALKEKDFSQIIGDINKSDAEVVYLVDILNITKESIEFIKYFKKKVFVLLTKRDLLPKSVKEDKIIEYFKSNFMDNVEVMCVSAVKKKNIDKFIKLMKEKNIKKLYVVGLTNSGKSTLINSLLESVKQKPSITTSMIPNTTMDYINIKLDEDLSIIDTPGFVLKNTIYNYISYKDISKITPKKEIKVKTFQMKEGQCVIVSDILRVEYLKGKPNSFSFYMNNNLNFERVKTTNEKLKFLSKKNIRIKGKEDIVINGLGFIKIIGEAIVVIYTLDENLISIRKSMI
jgi:ribosome biogenesis GTPase A